ncbi:hypothetical protein NDU88_007489 [Pleurodeles waltl]|uniref:Uncharacterized protein n=1 Tax=Pleurodeles waltl TaxID=8319 RepID=A0AAV7VTP8_PLEWA|nr:hypothetical protein NDU88_007489 [Pleurodeles waltl]
MQHAGSQQAAPESGESGTPEPPLCKSSASSPAGQARVIRVLRSGTLKDALPRLRRRRTQPPLWSTKLGTARRHAAGPTCEVHQLHHVRPREARRHGLDSRGGSLKNGAVSYRHTQGAVL